MCGGRGNLTGQVIDSGRKWGGDLTGQVIGKGGGGGRNLTGQVIHSERVRRGRGGDQLQSRLVF